MNSMNRLAAVAALCATVAACGGSGSSSPPPAPPAPPAAPVVVTFSAPSITASAVGQQGGPSAGVNVSITGSTQELYTGVGTTRRGVEIASMSGEYLDDLQVSVVFREAGTLPNGTYVDTLTMQVCRDADCASQIPGSPFTLPISFTVTDSQAIAVPTSLGPPDTFLSHDVVDATMSKPLNAIVMASTLPVNALYVYDVASGTEKTIALATAPSSLTLSPDGRKAAIGQNGQVGYVDLTDIAHATPTVREIAVPTEVWGLVLDANDFIQAFPAADQHVNLYTVDAAAGTNAPTVANIYSKTRARLHPDGDRMYLLDTLLTPENLARYALSDGMPTRVGESPYWGEWPMCGNLWFSEAGDRIYTACGNTFTSSPILSQDMLHAGHLPLTTDPGPYYGNIVWLDDSAALGQAALLDAGACASFNLGADAAVCDTLLRVTEHAHDGLVAAYWMPPVDHGGAYRVAHGMFVFHAADGSLRVIGRLAGVDDATQAFYIDLPHTDTNAAVQHAAVRRNGSR
jgi:hypothetical protein